MFRTILSLLCLAAFCLGACSPAGPAATASPAAAPSPLPSLTPEPSPAPAPPVTPTPQSGCTSAALYLADVTIPDLTALDPATPFTKTWRLKNTGTCTWNETYSLVFASGERMQAPASVPLSETVPGGTLDLSLEMVAPALDGIYTGIYELHAPDGSRLPVGTLDSIWVKIVVGELPPTPLPGAPTPVAPAGPCHPARDAAYVNQLLALINQARTAEKLPALNLDSRLSAAAQAHSEDMACNNFRSHTGSDGSSISARIAAQGYSASYVLETIFASGTAQTAFDWWMNDKLHRDVLLDPNVTEAGIGHAYTASSLYGDYYTVDLASP